MKKFLLIMIFLFAISELAFSQSEHEGIQFEESNVKIENPSYFGLGGGYVGSFLFLNLDEINTISKEMSLNDLKSPFFLSGAQGFTAIGIIPNIRIGFSGYSGLKKVEKVNDYKTTFGLKYGVGFTGFSIDYGFVIFKNFAILPGLGLGWSSIEITKYNISNFDWSNLKSNIYTSNILEGNFLFLEPHLTVEFAVTPFLMIRLGAQYPFSFAGKWNVNDVIEVTNVPSSLKPTGFAINFGIFVGLFNY